MRCKRGGRSAEVCSCITEAAAKDRGLIEDNAVAALREDGFDLQFQVNIDNLASAARESLRSRDHAVVATQSHKTLLDIFERYAERI